ncbi:MAG: septal ring lytic transglycosylase RlpA family protein [Desulfobulbaceae bacterium]|nr:septal ring lytic transglycosylase RlpA family protein [Desulfobulbaceae bacterium]
MKKIIAAALLLPAITLVTGCAARTVPIYIPSASSSSSAAPPPPPPRQQEVAIPAPTKWLPPAGRIPPTQRPYQIDGRTYYPLPSAEGFIQDGVASWYGDPFHGRKTSNGEIYDMHGMTAAHKTLPMHTLLLVKNQENGSEAVVRVNDRGPFVKDRILDLSYAAAQKLGVLDKGTANVEIVALGEATTSGEGDRKGAHFLPHGDFRHGDFYVQIGAFVNQENANRLKEKMEKRGEKTEIQTYDDGSRIFYRVQVRAGTDLDQAGRFEQAMMEAGFTGAFVVAR